MKSIDELRAWGYILHLLPEDRFWELVDAIEAEVAERYAELPLDADGMPWHLGDVTENGNTAVMRRDGSRTVWPMPNHREPGTVLSPHLSEWLSERWEEMRHGNQRR